MSQKKIFLICPVRNASPEVTGEIQAYVAALESQGHDVHWPARDTDQSDPHGLRICRTNFGAMLASNEVHIWFDPTSYGSVWDEGMLFAIFSMDPASRKVVLANPVVATPEKSFANVILWMAGKSK